MVSVTPHDFRDPQYCKHCGNLLFGAKPAALDPDETRERAVARSRAQSNTTSAPSYTVAIPNRDEHHWAKLN